MRVFDEKRFNQIVLYIINQINGSQLGNVKLNKILWFSDLEKCRLTSDTITGETYIRQDYGPVSKHLSNALNELKKNHSLRIERQDPESMWIYTPLKSTDIQFLSDDDKNIIDSQIKRLRDMRSSDISNMTHTLIWESLKNNDEIPVDAVAMEQFINYDTDIDWDHQ